MRQSPLDPARVPKHSTRMPPAESFRDDDADWPRDPDRDDDAGPAAAPAALRLFVRHSPPAQVGFLRRLVRLDVWGDTLRGSKVSDEMTSGYLILAVVFVFEVCAWSLLFNQIFHGTDSGIDGRTVVAVAMGLLWAMGIYTIDKGVLTADLTRRGASKWMGFAARALLIVASAVFTAQPVEQVVFGSMIEERLKQETLREEAIAHVKRIEDAEQKVRDLEDEDVGKRIPKQAKEDREAAQAAWDQRQGALADANAALTTADSALTSAQRELTSRRQWADRVSATHGADSPETRSARQRQATQQGRVHQLEVQRREAAEARQRAESAGHTADSERERVEAAYEAAVATARKEKQAILDRLAQATAAVTTFLDRFRRANYGDTIEIAEGERLRWKRVDFVGRGLVLEDLVAGRPPRWPAESAEQRRRAIALFGLPGATGLDGKPTHDTRSLFWYWLLVTLVAAAIPSLSLFFKYTMSEQLKGYYSVEHQARAGNPEALLALQSQGR